MHCGLSSFEIPYSLGIFPGAIPKSEISDNRSHHSENEFRQYDLKFPAPLWKRGTGIDEFCGSCLVSLSGTIVFPVISGLNPRQDDAKFLEFPKRAEGLSRAGRLSTTFPEVPIKCRVRPLGGKG